MIQELTEAPPAVAAYDEYAATGQRTPGTRRKAAPKQSAGDTSLKKQQTEPSAFVQVQSILKGVLTNNTIDSNQLRMVQSLQKRMSQILTNVQGNKIKVIEPGTQQLPTQAADEPQSSEQAIKQHMDPNSFYGRQSAQRQQRQQPQSQGTVNDPKYQDIRRQIVTAAQSGDQARIKIAQMINSELSRRKGTTSENRGKQI